MSTQSFVRARAIVTLYVGGHLRRRGEEFNVAKERFDHRHMELASTPASESRVETVERRHERMRRDAGRLDQEIRTPDDWQLARSVAAEVDKKDVNRIYRGQPLKGSPEAKREMARVRAAKSEQQQREE